VIADEFVAGAYQVLMNQLGVVLSPAKSLNSESILEFAKRLMSSGFDYSPIGARAILNASIGYQYIPSLLVDCLSKGIYYPALQLVGMIEELRYFYIKGVNAQRIEDLLLCLLGPTGILLRYISKSSRSDLVLL
jgi:hypothetical protein